MRILIFGDSIAQGFYDSEGGWADRIKKHYDRKLIEQNDLSQPTVFNLGVSGDTTNALLKRFENEIIARKWPGEEYIFIIATGTNDTIFRGQENDMEPEKFTGLLTELYDISLKYSKKILFVGLFPVSDEKLNPMPWSTTGKCYSTERMQKFNDQIKTFCSVKNIPFIDLFKDFNPSTQTFDGIHPNDDGHKYIADKIQPQLEVLVR